MTPHDAVISPSHYTSDSIECIDAIRSALGDEGFIAFCRGNAIKYQWRQGKKGDAAQDAGKARFYTQMVAHVLDAAQYDDPRYLREKAAEPDTSGVWHVLDVDGDEVDLTRDSDTWRGVGTHVEAVLAHKYWAKNGAYPPYRIERIT